MIRRIYSNALQFICGRRGHIASPAADTGNKWQNVEKQLPDPIGNLRSKL
ncbi:Unknown protein sequence [Pseudomonas savastanoi pv. phaseolicola]|nr:Unknown protein sequence [Pseudomonas savastanoi pv. phaseolicola]